MSFQSNRQIIIFSKLIAFLVNGVVIKENNISTPLAIKSNNITSRLRIKEEENA